MRLALGLGDVDKIEFGQALRLRENRARHLDVVVVRQVTHQLARRVANRRQAAGHFGARHGFDLGDEPAQHVIEQTDVVFAEGW